MKKGYARKQHLEIFCANVGDSRAIMCSFVDDNWQVQALNIDHKPDYIKERNRIL